MGEFPVGNCDCGAVYACDSSGWNVGTAMIEAMVYACNEDWDLAWDLTPDEDYLTDRVEPYDEITNQVCETGNFDGRKVKGVLYFVRLQGEAAELVAKLNQGGNDKPIIVPSYVPTVEPERDPKRKKQRAAKTLVKTLVENGDIDGLVDLVFDDMKTIRFMQRLLYSIDMNLRWKTIDAFGKVCARLATRKPGKVSDLLHRLFAACADSASSGWGNIETIGAIIGGRPDIFGSFAPHLLDYLGDAARLNSTLWALCAIARNKPELIRKIPFYQLFTLLDQGKPETKAYALRLFARIKASEARSKIEKLCSDFTFVTIYEDGNPVQTTIGQLAKEAIECIDQN